MMPVPLAGGGRFRVRLLPGPPPMVEKTGAAAPLAREAEALALLAGLPGVPPLLAHTPGRLRTGLLAGAPRPATTLTAAGLRALGALLRAVHGAASSDAGGLPGAADPPGTAAGQACARARDAAALAAAAGLRAPVAPPACADPPFRLLHGDLVLGNVVWDGDVPGLVDWEFWRYGDPAEDLAYLAGVNGLAAEAREPLWEGYGDPSAVARVPSWEPLVVLEAAAWWLREGEPAAAAPLLARLGLTPPSGPSARTPPGAGAPPGRSPSPPSTPPG